MSEDVFCGDAAIAEAEAVKGLGRAKTAVLRSRELHDAVVRSRARIGYAPGLHEIASSAREKAHGNVEIQDFMDARDARFYMLSAEEILRVDENVTRAIVQTIAAKLQHAHWSGVFAAVKTSARK